MLLKSLLFSSLLAAVAVASTLRDVGTAHDSPFHVYSSCTPLVNLYARVSTRFVDCTFNHALPPSWCTGCAQEYGDMLDTLDHIRHNDTTTSLGLRCSDVIFNSYMVSRVSESVEAVQRLWDDAYCSSCITFKRVLDNTTRTTHRAQVYSTKTLQFEEHLTEYRDCLRANGSLTNETHMCNRCAVHYKDMYAYYWDNFVYPDMDPFCIDIEATMNDTIKQWRHVFNCTQPPYNSRAPQTPLAMTVPAVLLLGSVLFYVLAFVQGERRLKKLTKYSEATGRSTNYLERSVSALRRDTIPTAAETTAGYDNPLYASGPPNGRLAATSAGGGVATRTLTTHDEEDSNEDGASRAPDVGVAESSEALPPSPSAVRNAASTSSAGGMDVSRAEDYVDTDRVLRF